MSKLRLPLTAALILACLPFLPFSLSAQAAKGEEGLQTVTEDVRKLKDEVSGLKDKLFTIQQTLLDAGVSSSLKDDVRRFQQELRALEQKMAAGGGASSEEIAALKAQVESLSTAIKSPAPEAETPAAATPDEVATKAGEAHLGTTMVWVLLCGFLVMFMQAGFAMVETGLTRAKNAAHTMSMNLLDYAIGMLAFWAFGFAIMFGNSGPADGHFSLGFTGLDQAIGIQGADGTLYSFFGIDGFFLAGNEIFTGGVFTLFLFQMVFAATANTICTGALAERWKMSAFCIASVVVTGFIYPLFGHWVWGGGWLATLGYWDFAGSTVVHMTGGVIALIGAMVVGPRVGKFNPDGSANPIPGHNLPMAFIGTFILAFGWFGFNTGSTLSGTDTQIGIIATNTALASGAGAVAAAIFSAFRFGKPDPSFCCNGLLGGLVGITAPCAYVDAWAAVLIGLIAGAIVVFSVLFVEETLKLDDPVGAISVHGSCGAWGGLALGLFANGKYADVSGLFFGNGKQFLIQCLGVATCFVVVGALSYVMFIMIEKLVGNRSTDEEQIIGLDLAEMGSEAYGSDPMGRK
jgi:Amt family ammonium transporter